MNPLLIIFNPRAIPDCMDAFAALDVPRAYLTGYTERGLIEPFARVVAETDYSHYLTIADDGVVRQSALDAVLALLASHPVATGWSNLDATEARVNLTRSPLTMPAPHPNAYDMYHWQEVMGYPSPVVPTYFAGMCLTGMSRDMWLRYPFDVYGDEYESGHGSDYRLCLQLQQDDIPIVAAREGYVYHVKERWSLPDRAEEKRLLIGKVAPTVTITE